MIVAAGALLCAAAFPTFAADNPPGARGWLDWRGPEQTGVSRETNLPDKWELGGTNDLWKVELRGRGTPVVNGDRVYAFGYRGEGAAMQEVLMCLDAATGNKQWEHTYSDFLSDIIYDRYSIGGPAIDPETGNVYVMTSPGILAGYSPDGKEIWRHSLMEEFGRLTFPNGRTGWPAIDGDLVIMHIISANWGSEGPPRDRFYAFHKKTGDLVWSSTPGVGPPFLKDSSFSFPIFQTRKDGKRVFYAGTGCGNIVCVNAKTGEPLWRYQFSIGGIGSTVVLHKDKVIAIHGVENIDNSKSGRMVALRTDVEPVKGEDGTMQLPRDAEVWRLDIAMFTSSPIIVGDRVYQTEQTGVLYAIDANTGKVHWQKKLAPDQIHASPIYADGKIYVPMNNGSFYILKDKGDSVEVLSKTQLSGNALGAPAVWNGRLFVFTTDALYAFGSKNGNPQGLPKPIATAPQPAPGKAVKLQALPAEVLLAPGGQKKVTARAIDANGYVVGPVENVQWQKFVPPTAKVKAEMDAEFNSQGILAADKGAKLSAGSFKGTSGELSGTMRGRVLPDLPFSEDFESFQLTEKAPDGQQFAYPHLPWIGARFKWEVRDVDGNKAFRKTLDSLILQRATTFIASDELSNYTIQADVMTDGNRRLMSEVGLINQRYIISLKGSHGQIEVSSNHERVKEAVDFDIKPKTWYTLKTRVDVNPDGTGVVRGKAWQRGSAEPDAWNIEVKVPHVHTKGSPGLFGFAPSNQFAVYVDNIKITANK